MLRSTGFFRGIDCPFYAECSEDKGSRNGCNRPYCHFRHSKQRRASYGAAADVKKQRGYDPFNPEVVNPQDQQDGDLSGALEMVNKAIEEVRSQVEREKRKLSRIGDEPYNPSKSTSITSSDAVKSKAPPSHMAYDPGSYQMTSGGYNPAPGCSKYSLDSDKQGNHSNSMEYVPTSVKKYSNSTSSSKCKYTVDNSKPSTDMEYDPLSNYSAGIAAKSKREGGAKAVKSHKLQGSNTSDQEYVVAAKKPRQQGVDSKKYTFSDSDGEKKKKVAGQSSSDKRGKSEKVHKAVKEVNKTSGSKSVSSSSKDKESIKNSSQDSAKKENKSHEKRDDRKSTVKVKSSDKSQREGREEKRSDGKINAAENVKTDSRKRDKDAENFARESKKPKVSDKEKEHSRYKDHNHKNGKLDSCKRQKDVKKNSKSSSSSSNSSKGCSANSKEKEKHNISSSNGKKLEGKRRSASLSHADLFGDESPEEASPIMMEDSDEEEEEEEVLVRKSADALKRGRLNKRKASELTPSSSDEEAVGGVEDDAAGKDELDGVGIDFSSFQDDLDFDSDPMEECLRIFNESKDVKREDKGRQAKQVSMLPSQHLFMCFLSFFFNTFFFFFCKSFYLTVKITKSLLQPADVRPVANRVLSPNQSHETVKPQTTAGILSKTSSTVMQRRVAHTPTMKSGSMKRPVIPTEFGAKVPTNVRQRYLTTFIDECVKFCPSEKDALDEEKLVYERSSSKNIYLNVAVNTLKKLRGKSSSRPSADPGSAANRKAQSHEEVLGGRLAATTSFTVNRTGKQQEEKLIGATLYKRLQAYLMTEEQFQENGYPRTNPESAGRAVIHNLPEKKPVTDPFNKICCRCGAEYKINVNGSCVRKEECTFHWGRLRRHKVAGGWETNYSCCAAAVGSPGCQVCKQHVQDGRKESLDGFVTTFSKALPPDGNGGVFALDCEMCYTKQGLELTRVTVIDSEMKVIYDTFVKPESKVVDYNTRFSGVTEEDLEDVTISLRDVQAVLLSMFSAESILIGHSLESDLLALKLIHSTVVDTAIVFPHRLGLPFKRALRNLMADHLKRIIQDNVDGHDSSEDASACMELMVWKIKEDAKLKR
uniref:REX1, RNA exonuclease 1 homolog n=1 Tax=Labrus bergylta TaxID=56723 RepID=A0A3Q3GR05_9LABR